MNGVQIAVHFKVFVLVLRTLVVLVLVIDLVVVYRVLLPTLFCKKYIVSFSLYDSLIG